MKNEALSALEGLVGEWDLTMTDRWEASEDAGGTWRKDFDLAFVRRGS